MLTADELGIRKELAEKREKFTAMKAKWENEKNAISKVQDSRKEN